MLLEIEDITLCSSFILVVVDNDPFSKTIVHLQSS